MRVSSPPAWICWILQGSPTVDVVTTVQDCNRVQCLSRKSKDWQPEPDDEDYEREAQSCLVTGISVGPPDEWEIGRLFPMRHNVHQGFISNMPEPVRP